MPDMQASMGSPQSELPTKKGPAMTTTVPKETPESLTAWAERADEAGRLRAWAEREALTLTDEQWRACLNGWPHELHGGDDETVTAAKLAKGDALLAVLDRIAGELTPRRLAYLQSAKECDSLYSYKFRGKVRTEMVAAGLVYRLPPPGASCYAPTPLGRAVLARTEGRR
jgi:hypothetical protein